MVNVNENWKWSGRFRAQLWTPEQVLENCGLFPGRLGGILCKSRRIRDFLTSRRLIQRRFLENRENLIPVRDTGWMKNLIVTDGKAWGAKIAIGETSDTLNYSQPGTGTSVPVVGDTDLEGAIGSRKQATLRTRSGNVSTISTFFAASEGNGVWNKVGLFFAASGTPGMFAEQLLGDQAFTKDTSKTATLDWVVTSGAS